MNKTKYRTLLYFFPAILAAFIVSSCTAAGMGDVNDDPGNTEVEILVIPSAALYGIIGSPDPAATAASEEASLIATSASTGVILAQLYITLVYEGWDPNGPAVYSNGTTSISWIKSGDTITWTYTYDFGGTPSVTVIEVTDKGSSKDVLIKIDGSTYISGSVLTDGTSGNARLYPDPEDSSISYNTVWEPSASPYDLVFTVSEYSGETVTAVLTINTSYDGESGTWSYASPPGAAPIGNQWPEG